MFQIGIRSIIRKDFEETYKVIKSLRNQYYFKKRVFFLSTLLKLCKYFPPAYYLYALLDKIYNAYWRKEFHHLLRKLEIIEETELKILGEEIKKYFKEIGHFEYE